jgi:hypothetical protein
MLHLGTGEDVIKKNHPVQAPQFAIPSVPFSKRPYASGEQISAC